MCYICTVGYLFHDFLCFVCGYVVFVANMREFLILKDIFKMCTYFSADNDKFYFADKSLSLISKHIWPPALVLLIIYAFSA